MVDNEDNDERTAAVAAARRRGFNMLKYLAFAAAMVVLILQVTQRLMKDHDSVPGLLGVRSDLLRLAVAESTYFAANRTYTALPRDTIAGVLDFEASYGVDIHVHASATGWSAVGTHERSAGLRCSIGVGDAVPLLPAGSGEVVCER